MTSRVLSWFFAVGLALASAAFAHGLSEEIEQVAELINLRPGMTVADVGAGDGELAEALIDRLDGSGHVYVTEVSERALRRLKRTFQRVDNVSVVEGKEDDSELPEVCCDAILLRYVYHHMSRRSEMRSSLRRSLRADGLLVVVDKEEPGDGVALEQLVADMTGDGFEVVSRHPEWGAHEGHYCVVFRPSDGP